MRSGMTASVEFVISEKTQVLLIQRSAVQMREKKLGMLVPVVDDTEFQRPEFRSVELGESDGKVVEVLNGMQEGERYLINEVKFGAADAKSNPLAPFSGRRRQPGGGNARPRHP